MKFKHIVSLGYNCEVSYRIEDFTGEKIESYPFTWAYMKNQKEIYNTLEMAINGQLTNGEYCVTRSKMFHFYGSGCLFHSKAENKDLLLLQNGLTNYEASEKYRKEIDSRLNHLQQKFKELLQSNERTLFILKISPEQDNEAAEKIVQDTIAFFQKYAANWHLLVMEEEGKYDLESWEQKEQHVSVRAISDFATDGNTKYGGNRAEWVRIISEIDQKYGEDLLTESKNEEGSAQRADFVEQYIHALDIIESQKEKLDAMNRAIESLNGQIKELIQSREEIWNSNTWKAGKMVMAVPKWMKSKMKRT